MKLETKIDAFSWYREHRKEQYDTVKLINKNIGNRKNFIIIKAPVKSGKKDIAIIYALYQDIFNNKDKSKEMYTISALHRRADEIQRNQLREYFGRDNVCSIYNKSKAEKFIKDLNKLIVKNKKIDILLDELDYGSGGNQIMSKIWNFSKQFPNQINIIGFSATPEEALPEYVKTPDINERKCVIQFIPHSSYYGIKNFIQDGRFKQSTNFFEIYNDRIEISFQGDHLITDLLKDTKNKNNAKHLAILRLSGRVKKIHGGGTEFELIKELKDEIEKLVNEEWGNIGVKFKMKFISSKEEDGTLDWSSDSEWDDYQKNIAYLIIVNEVAKRSTEWRCQPYMSWYHTHRPNGAKNTKDQDEQRSVYYKNSFDKVFEDIQKYNEEIKSTEIDFTIYGDKTVAEVSAGLKPITELSEYKRKGIKLSGNTIAKYKNNQINNINWQHEFNKKEKKAIEKKHPKFESTINYKVNRTKHPISKDKKFTQSEWNIPDKVLKTYKNLIGFRLTNMRGDLSQWLIDVCLKGEILKPPVKFKKDIEKDKNEGLNNKTKTRKNIYYENDEENPDNYKFCLRYNKETITTSTIINKSMFSNNKLN